MIILEGPDGGGKTHLANRICEEFDLEYMRYEGVSSTSGPDGPAIIEWWDDQISSNKQKVYDRCFYISEPIYQLATPHRELIAAPVTMIHGILRLTNFTPLTIFCIPPWEAAIANVSQRERLEGVDDLALKKIHWAYHVAYALWSEALYHNVSHWDYTIHDEVLMLEQVSEYLRRFGGG
jgi:hypothetical protein